MSAIKTPQDRYLNEPGFNRMVDSMVALMRDRGWTYGDIHDAWALAEGIRYQQQMRELTGEGGPNG